MKAIRSQRMKRRTRIAATPTGPAKAVKVAVDLPPALFLATEEAMRELSMNRSSLIRAAVEMFLHQRKQQKLESAIAESFRANRDLERDLVDEFRYVDAEAEAKF